MALLKWVTPEEKTVAWELCSAGHKAESKALPLFPSREQGKKGRSCCSCHHQQSIPEPFQRHQVPREAWSFTAFPPEGQQEASAPHDHSHRCEGGLRPPKRSYRCHQSRLTGSWAAVACRSSLITLSKVTGTAGQKSVTLISLSDNSAHLNYWDKCLHWEKSRLGIKKVGYWKGPP